MPDQHVLLEFFHRDTQTMEKAIGAFQMGHFALRRDRHIEVTFQSKVLKTGHFEGSFGMKYFEGYNLWTLP